MKYIWNILLAFFFYTFLFVDFALFATFCLVCRFLWNLLLNALWEKNELHCFVQWFYEILLQSVCCECGIFICVGIFFALATCFFYSRHNLLYYSLFRLHMFDILLLDNFFYSNKTLFLEHFFFFTINTFSYSLLQLVQFWLKNSASLLFSTLSNC